MLKPRIIIMTIAINVARGRQRFDYVKGVYGEKQFLVHIIEQRLLNFVKYEK